MHNRVPCLNKFLIVRAVKKMMIDVPRSGFVGGRRSPFTRFCGTASVILAIHECFIETHQRRIASQHVKKIGATAAGRCVNEYWGWGRDALFTVGDLSNGSIAKRGM